MCALHTRRSVRAGLSALREVFPDLGTATPVLDAEMTVRQVRSVASDVNDGASVEQALDEDGVTLGRMAVTLPPRVYQELRREAALEDVDPDDIVAGALERRFDGHR